MYNALINSDKDDSILHLIDSARRLPVYVHLLKYFNVQIEICVTGSQNRIFAQLKCDVILHVCDEFCVFVTG